jgi:hypothetical protein
MSPYSKTLKVLNYDELRDALSSSGLFEMTDCAIEIWCPEASEVQEIQRMTSLIESMVHVTDVKIGSDVENLAEEGYRIVLNETPRKIGRAKFTRER